MAIPFQTFDFIFGDKGLDGKTDPHLSTNLLSLENAVAPNPGAWEKRPGTSALGTDVIGGTSLGGAATELTYLGDELLLVDTDTLYGYSSTLSKWVARTTAQDFPSVKLERKPVAAGTKSITKVDACTSGNITMTAWEISGPEVHVQVIDNVTGTVLLKDTVVSASARSTPRCVALGTRLYVFYCESGGTNLYTRYVTTSAPQTLAAEILVATNAASSNTILAVTAVSSSVACLAYDRANSGADKGVIALYGTAGDAITSSITFDMDALTIDAFYHAALDDIFVAIEYNNNVYVIQLNTDLSTATTWTSVDSGANYAHIAMCAGFGANSSKLVIYFVDETGTAGKIGASGTYTSIHTNAYLVGGVTATLTAPAGRPFVQGNERICLPIILPEKGYFLVDGITGNVIAPILVGHVPATFSACGPATVLAISSTEFWLPIMEAVRVEAVDGRLAGVTGFTFAQITFDTTETSNAILGETRFFARGLLWEYDGVSAYEHGFHIRPTWNAFPDTVGSMAHVEAVHQTVSVMEWIDAKGQRHKGQVSNNEQVTMNGTTHDSIEGQHTPIALTRRTSTAFAGRQDLTITAYSTLGNGTTYFRYGHQSADPVTGTQVYNTPQATSTQDYDRHVSDASIDGNELLYTTGGVLPNDPPPATNLIWAHGSRMWLVPSEYPDTLWYSKKHVPGEGVAFSELLTMRVADTNGAITAGASMDDKSVIFKRSAIYYVAGDGPDPTGGNNSFSQPTLIASDVGCTNARSVVLTPAGLMFESAKGIYLLDRSLQVVPIGHPVTAYDSATITRAVAVEDKNQVRFYTSGGSTLVYDTNLGKWGVFTGQSAVDAVAREANTYYVTTAGVVRYDNSSVFQESAVSYAPKVRTGWIALAGINGFQRVQKIQVSGKYYSAHTLRMTVYYDDETSGTNYDAATTEFIGADGAYEPVFHLSRQKCKRISIELTEASAASGQSVAFTGISLLVGTKKGLRKAPAAKKVA